MQSPSFNNSTAKKSASKLKNSMLIGTRAFDMFNGAYPGSSFIKHEKPKSAIKNID